MRGCLLPSHGAAGDRTVAPRTAAAAHGTLGQPYGGAASSCPEDTLHLPGSREGEERGDGFKHSIERVSVLFLIKSFFLSGEDGQSFMQLRIQ